MLSDRFPPASNDTGSPMSSSSLIEAHFSQPKTTWSSRLPLSRYWSSTSSRPAYLDDTRKRKLMKRIGWSIVFILLVTSLAIVTWLALTLTVANRLRLPRVNNGLQQILQTYHAPTPTSAAFPTWTEHFSQGIIPVPCHSHNDYWHRVPLYEGLAAGCISTEADIWVGTLPDRTVDLFVGHNHKSLSQSRTLRSLYLDPIIDVLTHQNAASENITTPSTSAQLPSSEEAGPVGVFTTSPNTSLILLLDFKTGDQQTWDAVRTQLTSLRSKNWLTTWTPSLGLMQGPLTIVASGEAPFKSIVADSTYRDIFFDAPIGSLSSADAPYNSNNSYYASSSLGAAVGTVHFGTFKDNQKKTIEAQVAKSKELGLKSRYWGIPKWPVGWRNRIWDQLVRLGVDTLNVDEVIDAARWDWAMCTVGGIQICNS